MNPIPPDLATGMSMGSGKTGAHGGRRGHLDPSAFTEEAIYLFRESSDRRAHSLAQNPLKFIFLLGVTAAPLLVWTTLFSAMGEGVEVNASLTARSVWANTLMGATAVFFSALYILDARYWETAPARLLRALAVGVAVGGACVATVLSIRKYPITSVVFLFLCGLPYCVVLYSTVYRRHVCPFVCPSRDAHAAPRGISRLLLPFSSIVLTSGLCTSSVSR